MATTKTDRVSTRIRLVIANVNNVYDSFYNFKFNYNIALSCPCQSPRTLQINNTKEPGPTRRLHHLVSLRRPHRPENIPPKIKSLILYPHRDLAKQLVITNADYLV